MRIRECGLSRQMPRDICQSWTRYGRVTMRQKQREDEDWRPPISQFVVLPRLAKLAALQRYCARRYRRNVPKRRTTVPETA